mmetsp:Transcript_47256/g.106523  ORF Transcript_47256/g.106523 Transcript_47256/m.106523 type:complete len:267 (-) Transcript_47256:265-1065(-)
MMAPIMPTNAIIMKHINTLLAAARRPIPTIIFLDLSRPVFANASVARERSSVCRCVSKSAMMLAPIVSVSSAAARAARSFSVPFCIRSVVASNRECAVSASRLSACAILTWILFRLPPIGLWLQTADAFLQLYLPRSCFTPQHVVPLCACLLPWLFTSWPRSTHDVIWVSSRWLMCVTRMPEVTSTYVDTCTRTRTRTRTHTRTRTGSVVEKSSARAASSVFVDALVLAAFGVSVAHIQQLGTQWRVVWICAHTLSLDRSRAIPAL